MYSSSPVSYRAVSDSVLRDGASRAPAPARRFAAVHRRRVRGDGRNERRPAARRDDLWQHGSRRPRHVDMRGSSCAVKGRSLPLT
jgi:hypothetical protein